VGRSAIRYTRRTSRDAGRIRKVDLVDDTSGGVSGVKVNGTGAQRCLPARLYRSPAGGDRAARRRERGPGWLLREPQLRRGGMHWLAPRDAAGLPL